MRMRRDQFSTLARGMQPYQNKPGVATIIAPGGGEGASSAGYVAGHIKDPDTGIAYGYHWGINGGPTDQSAKLQAMINEVGEAGGGRIVIRSRVPTDPITINQLTSIYHDNVHLEFRSPVKLNAVGGLRIMGRMDEYVRPPATNAGKLRANATEGATILMLDDAPGTMQATDFLDGDFIVVRGLNRADGNAIQKQYVFVKSRDLINNNLELSAELEETFQPFYGPGAAPIESSEYGPDATTGTTIYVIRNGQALANITRGMYEFEVTNIVNFQLFDLIRVADTRNEHDVNPSAIRASGLPYENECNMEFARIIKITPTTGGQGIVTLDHAISKEYWSGAPYYAGISVVKPVQNSRISGYDISYSEEQTSKNYHAITIAFAFNCHTFNGYIDGYSYRRGQGVRIADSYLCSGYNLLIEGGLFDGPNPLAPGSGSGENYGATLYKCTGCWYTDVITKDCRHGFLVQAASLFSLLNCQSWGDRISGFDLHGALEFDGVIDTCTAIRSNGHTPDAENGAGFRPGNTSHTPGAHHCIFRNCIAVGYQETNCAGFDFLPNSSNIEFNNCQVFGAYYGITFTRNSKQVTPVQDCEHIRIINCTFYDCIDRAVRIIGAPDYVYDPETGIGNSNGKIKGLTIKGCNTVRCGRHYVIDGNLGVENLLMEGNDIIDPVALAGQYAYDIKDLNGYNSFRNNGAIGANKGMYLQNVLNATVVTNVLTPTIEATPFTDGGGNTGLQYIDVFTGGSGSIVTATQLIATNNTIIGGTGVKGTYIQGAGTDGVRFWAGYTGYSAYWDGSTWKVGTDGASNGGALIIATGNGSVLKTYIFPHTGIGIQSILPGNLSLYESVEYIPSATFVARGDILAGIETGVGYSRIPIGSPGQVLTVHPDNEAGVYWTNPVAQFTNNPLVVNGTPQYRLSETGLLTVDQANWAWVASSGSLRLRLYSDAFTSSVDNIFFRRDELLNLVEIETVPLKFGIGIAPTRTLHLGGTLKVEFGDDTYSTLGWGKAIELNESHVIQWLKNTSPISRAMGMDSNGTLFFIRSTGNGPTGTGSYDMALGPTGNLYLYQRMSINTGSSGSAGIWLNDSASVGRAFMGLYEDDVTPIWGVWVAGQWRFYINSSGEMSIGGTNNRLPVPGVSLAIPGLIRLYQNDNYNRSADWFINAGIVYLSNYDTQAGGYMPLQIRAREVSLWATPNTGSGGEVERLKTTLGAVSVYAPLVIENNNTYREAMGGNLIVGGSEYTSHIAHGAAESTYIRGGKYGAWLYLQDVPGNVAIGSPGWSIFIQSNFNSWTALPYTTNFSDYNTGSNTNGRYRKIGDIVFIEGFIKRASGNSDMTFAVLPEGYRPTKDFNQDIQLLYNGTYYHARVTVFTSGSMSITYPLAGGGAGQIGTSSIGYFIVNFNFSVL